MTRAKPKPPVRTVALPPVSPAARMDPTEFHPPAPPSVLLAAKDAPTCQCRSCNPPPPDARTWWRGVENPARQVEGRFGTVWRPLVEIVWMGQRPIYLDDAEGKGWRKVTEGKASPQWAHVELIPQEVRDRG